MGQKESTIIALFMLLAGFILIYAGIQGKSPKEVLMGAIGNKGSDKTPPTPSATPSPSSHNVPIN